ncbi:MAG: acetyl-CoA carboxylase biotin carboxyl carrier protein [Planctomycetes bacterium]|nr:acetyl-CoA carboxylase biotin carboxyl carrier protein [Planctomycetota bacterium]
MDLDPIKQLIALMNEHSLAELDYEKEGLKVRLKKAGQGFTGGQQAIFAMPPFQQAAQAPELKKAEDPSIYEVKSPLVGTFYRSPSPDAPVFVEIGDKIAKDKPLCIVEAMKVMNDIRSAEDGVVEEILASNGDPVEFGQVLFRIRKGK